MFLISGFFSVRRDYIFAKIVVFLVPVPQNVMIIETLKRFSLCEADCVCKTA